MLRGTSEMLLTDKIFGFVFCTQCWIGFELKEVFMKMKIKKPLLLASLTTAWFSVSDSLLLLSGERAALPQRGGL